jgi:hypothetical protein
MENILFKSLTSEKKDRLLKICTAVSFLLIISPSMGADYNLMVVDLFIFFSDLVKGQSHYDIFHILIIFYCISLIYLIGFSYAHRRTTYILVLAALTFLSIPGILDAFFLIFAGSYFNLSILTIALFFFFAINLFVTYRRKLSNG